MGLVNPRSCLALGLRVWRDHPEHGSLLCSSVLTQECSLGAPFTHSLSCLTWLGISGSSICLPSQVSSSSFFLNYLCYHIKNPLHTVSPFHPHELGLSDDLHSLEESNADEKSALWGYGLFSVMLLPFWWVIIRH